MRSKHSFVSAITNKAQLTSNFSVNCKVTIISVFREHNCKNKIEAFDFRKKTKCFSFTLFVKAFIAGDFFKAASNFFVLAQTALIASANLELQFYWLDFDQLLFKELKSAAGSFTFTPRWW